MRFILILLLLSSITFSELGLDYLLAQDTSICLCDSPIEGQSESEHQDNKEDESKIDYLTDKELTNIYGTQFLKRASYHLAFIQLAPYLEIHNPPPDIT